MTYPPPGGENPQYRLQPEPQQPADPHMQAYGSTPPPPGNYYQPPQQYTQPPSQPMMSPQVGVQPGYPPVPGSVLPPPIPPAKQGGNLVVILGVVVVLVVVLGVAAVLIIPGLVNDDGDAQADNAATSSAEASPEATEPEPSEEETSADEEEPVTDEEFATWGTAVNSDDFDPNTPEGAAITYMVSADSGDDAALQAVVCASPSEDLAWYLDYELEGDGEQYGFLYWGVSREVDGKTEAWAGWTWDDTAPSSQSEMDGGGGYNFTAVEEDGQWKVCDIW